MAGCVRLAGTVALVLFATATQAGELFSKQQSFHAIYQELSEINTTDSVGDTVKAADAMAARLRAGGLTDVQVLSSGPRKGNMVVRLKGTGARRPLLLLAHLDV